MKSMMNINGDALRNELTKLMIPFTELSTLLGYEKNYISDCIYRGRVPEALAKDLYGFYDIPYNRYKSLSGNREPAMEPNRKGGAQKVKDVVPIDVDKFKAIFTKRGFTYSDLDKLYVSYRGETYNHVTRRHVIRRDLSKALADKHMIFYDDYAPEKEEVKEVDKIDVKEALKVENGLISLADIKPVLDVYNGTIRALMDFFGVEE